MYIEWVNSLVFHPRQIGMYIPETCPEYEKHHT